jgi:hypothetical protein
MGGRTDENLFVEKEGEAFLLTMPIYRRDVLLPSSG